MGEWASGKYVPTLLTHKFCRQYFEEHEQCIAIQYIALLRQIFDTYWDGEKETPALSYIPYAPHLVTFPTPLNSSYSPFLTPGQYSHSPRLVTFINPNTHHIPHSSLPTPCHISNSPHLTRFSTPHTWSHSPLPTADTFHTPHTSIQIYNSL